MSTQLISRRDPLNSEADFVRAKGGSSYWHNSKLLMSLKKAIKGQAAADHLADDPIEDYEQ